MVHVHTCCDVINVGYINIYFYEKTVVWFAWKELKLGNSHHMPNFEKLCVLLANQKFTSGENNNSMLINHSVHVVFSWTKLSYLSLCEPFKFAGVKTGSNIVHVGQIYFILAWCDLCSKHSSIYY